MVLYRRFGDQFLRVTAYSTIASLVFQATVSFFYSRGGLRGSVLFNNPNQLGYYALLSATVLVLLQNRVRMRPTLIAATLLVAAYLATLASSKSALLGMAILFGLALFQKIRTVLILSVLAGVAISTLQPIQQAINNAEYRIENDTHHEFFLERGYDRILNNPEYWITGAGEGYFGRFSSSTLIGSAEIHSSYGTIFFCYGILGSLVFLFFLYQLFKGVPFRRAIIMVPAGAYSVVHQGLRFTLLWMVLALVTCHWDEGNQTRH
jgi:hypothetical protein